MNLKKIDINCDLGEGVSNEVELFTYINSCSIACGGHYGNKVSISRTMELAISNRVSAGAHPSYPDRDNFGRKSMELSESQFKSSLQDQLDLYFEVLNAYDVKNNHIKAHGALYTDLCQDRERCSWFLEVVQRYDYQRIYTPFNGALAGMAQDLSMVVVFEAFVDRNYDPKGMLVKRIHPGALKNHSTEVWEQLYTIQVHQKVKAIDGAVIPMKADTFCIHGDHPKALKNLRFIRQNLNEMER